MDGARKKSVAKPAPDAGLPTGTTSARMTAPHVCMTIQWLVPVGKTRSMTEALHSLMASTRSEAGCIACSVSADVGRKGKIRPTQKRLSQDPLQQQFQTQPF